MEKVEEKEKAWLRRKLAEVKKEKAWLESQRAEWKKKKVEEVKKMAEMEKENAKMAEMEKENAKMERDLAEMEKELAEMEKEKVEEKEKAWLRRKLAEKQEEKEEAEKKEKAWLRRKLAEKQKRYAKMERENARLEREEARLERELARLRVQQAQEDALWGTELGKNRHHTSMPIKMSHTKEMLDNIVSEDEELYTLTRNHKDVFDDTLHDLHHIIEKSNHSLHFWDDADIVTDSGDPCKLYTRHFLLMCNIRKAHNWAQEELGVFFGIEQSTVSQYLEFDMEYNDELYIVTPANISQYISTIKSEEELEEILPGKNDDKITIDGIIVETERPEDKDEQIKQHSDKKKEFAISATILLNKNRYIVGIVDSRGGNCHGLTVLTQRLPDFGKWMDMMISGEHIPETRRIRLNLDDGHAEIESYLHKVNAKITYKKSKGGELVSTQKKSNESDSRKRVPVENVFEHIKNPKRIAGRYDGTAQQFNIEFNGICGMYNKRKMWKDGTYQHWKTKILNNT